MSRSGNIFVSSDVDSIISEFQNIYRFFVLQQKLISILNHNE